MAVKAISAFVGVAKDVEANFHGARLLYVGWDQHLMFYAPFCLCLPPVTPFRDLVEKILPESFSKHPDFARINWDEVEWTRNGAPFAPDFDKTLDENGVGHKHLIRMRTPGLNGINGSGF